MYFMIFKKMLRNKWLVLCLLLGILLAIAMISSIPMYSSGILQRMLIKDLENYQTDSGVYPGRYQIKNNLFYHSKPESRVDLFLMINEKITQEFVLEIPLPTLSEVTLLSINYIKAYKSTGDTDLSYPENKDGRFITMNAISDLSEKVRIIDGALPSNEMKGNIMEVMVTEGALKTMDLVVGEVYSIYDFVKEVFFTNIRITGVFTSKDPTDTFWFQGLSRYNEAVFVNYELFYKEIIDKKATLLTSTQFSYAFDYHMIDLNDVNNIIEAYDSQVEWISQYRGLHFSMPSIEILEKYNERKKELRITLWVLQIPILLMLAFYMYIVSKLIIDYEKNEIKVMQSRGAKRLWIFSGYLLESTLLCIVTYVPGVLLGMFLCRLLGAADGFLVFVQRTALDIKIDTVALLYSLVIVVISITATVIPAYKASKTNIVEYKQKKSRFFKQVLWKKLFLDIILLAISIYGLYTYQLRQDTLEVTGVKSTEIAIDPILFLSSTFFILGLGLFCLRFFPYAIKFIYHIGKKIWPSSLYISFTHVGRSEGKEQFLMVFLILAVSIGIFNANTARSINSNIEDKVNYMNGADITLTALWANNKPPENSFDPASMSSTSSFESNEPIIYIEPDFELYEDLEGIESVTKVLRKDNTTVRMLGGSVRKVSLMGIIPEEFGKTAWFRDGLFPSHWNNYLNILSSEPTAIFLSSSFREDFGLKEGDIVTILPENQGYLEGIIYAFVDYWPTFNPEKQILGSVRSYLIVMNLPYIHSQLSMEPYEVWMKKKSGITSEQIYDELHENNINVIKLDDAGQKILIAKNDPMLQGANGALTLGFMVAMGICLLGFLIYWILSIKKRILQFGIFRAMGMSKSGIIVMLIFEQFLISGTALLLGVIIGGISSELFVPLLQITQSAAEQVPPFKVAAKASDYVKVYLFAGGMLTLGFIVLGIIASKIKIHQVLKLGED